MLEMILALESQETQQQEMILYVCVALYALVFAAYRPSRLQSILRLPPPKRPETEIAKIGQLLRPLEAFATINPEVH